MSTLTNINAGAARAPVVASGAGLAIASEKKIGGFSAGSQLPARAPAHPDVARLVDLVHACCAVRIGSASPARWPRFEAPRSSGLEPHCALANAALDWLKTSPLAQCLGGSHVCIVIVCSFEASHAHHAMFDDGHIFDGKAKLFNPRRPPLAGLNPETPKTPAGVDQPKHHPDPHPKRYDGPPREGWLPANPEPPKKRVGMGQPGGLLNGHAKPYDEPPLKGSLAGTPVGVGQPRRLMMDLLLSELEPLSLSEGDGAEGEESDSRHERVSTSPLGSSSVASTTTQRVQSDVEPGAAPSARSRRHSGSGGEPAGVVVTSGGHDDTQPGLPPTGSAQHAPPSDVQTTTSKALPEGEAASAENPGQLQDEPDPVFAATVSSDLDVLEPGAEGPEQPPEAPPQQNGTPQSAPLPADSKGPATASSTPASAPRQPNVDTRYEATRQVPRGHVASRVMLHELLGRKELGPSEVRCKPREGEIIKGRVKDIDREGRYVNLETNRGDVVQVRFENLQSIDISPVMTTKGGQEYMKGKGIRVVAE